MSKVLAVLEQRDGTLRKVSFEVVTAARRLSSEVDAVVCGSTGPEGCATAIAERAKSGGGGYGALVFAATATGKDLAPRVAAKLGVGVAADVTDLTVEGDAIVATRPVYAGKAMQKVRVLSKPAVVSVRPNVFTPDAQASQVKPETLSVAAPGRVVVREIKAAPAGMLDVAEAQIIISGGRHDLERDFAQSAVALLEHGEDFAHKTFASSRSTRISSGTAPAPSPTILPSLRSGGGVSAMISNEPVPSCTGLTSSGFFLAAMIPFSAG